MADVQINQGNKRVFSEVDGETIRWTPDGSADTYVIHNILDVRVTPGGIEAVVQRDKGKLLTDALQGREQPTTITITVKKMDPTATSALRGLFHASPSGGLMPKGVLQRKIPDADGAVAGFTETYNDVVVATSGPSDSRGDEGDTEEYTFLSMDHKPTTARF